MVIDSSGYVGINNTSPGEALDVVGNINATGDVCLDSGECTCIVCAAYVG